MHATVEVVTRSVAAVSVRYPVRPRLEAWVLPECTVPESFSHDEAADRLTQTLKAWAAQSGRNVRVARNLAIRFLQSAPKIGIDPDVCVLEPPPPEAHLLGSLCLWKVGHVTPTICVEIVSKNHPHKDYAEIQDRYAAIGTKELVVFDPLLAGPIGLGGPVPLQLWRRDSVGVFERVQFGAEPVFSLSLNAWFIAEDRYLRIADDPEGKHLWLTFEERAERERVEKERERVEKERERAEKERERAAREDVERRLEALEKKAE